MLSKSFYNDFDISIIVFSWFKVNKYIIKIYNYKVVDNSRQYFVNIGLECRWSVSKTKGHY
jgi:hypothetical protein